MLAHYPASHPINIPSNPYNITGVSMGDITNPTVDAHWYDPNSFAFGIPYTTPRPYLETDKQPWSLPARSSVPNALHTPWFVEGQIPNDQITGDDHRNAARPRSSPSTFDIASETVPWPLHNGLGIYPASSLCQLTPVTPTFPPVTFPSFSNEAPYVEDRPIVADQQQNSTSIATPEIVQPKPRRPYANIAPDPAGVAAKRKRDEDDQEDFYTNDKKRNRTCAIPLADLNPRHRLLVTLKEQANLPWKDIAARVSEAEGKTVQVATLQMAYTRMRERYRIWSESDITALREAHDLWEKKKWENISETMMKSGIAEGFSAKQCAKKWQELEFSTGNIGAIAGLTPAMSPFFASQFSSPIDGPPPQQWSWFPSSQASALSCI